MTVARWGHTLLLLNFIEEKTRAGLSQADEEFVHGVAEMNQIA